MYYQDLSIVFIVHHFVDGLDDVSDMLRVVGHIYQYCGLDFKNTASSVF